MVDERCYGPEAAGGRRMEVRFRGQWFQGSVPARAEADKDMDIDNVDFRSRVHIAGVGRLECFGIGHR